MFQLADSEKEALQKASAFYRMNYLSLNSLKSYMTGIRAFVSFCLYFGYLVYLPATDEQLAGFVTFMAQTVTPQTIKQYLFGVRALHLVTQSEFTPWAKRFPVWQAFLGIKRFLGDEHTQKLALIAEILSQLWPVICGEIFDNVLLMNVWAAILVGYFGMLRKDNLTVEKQSSFNPYENLCRGDFVFVEKDGKPHVVWVRIRQSKTNQFCERVHYLPLMAIEGHFMCPYFWLQRVFETCPASDEAPAFQMPKGSHGMGPLTHSVFTKTLKLWLNAAGFDASKFSGHSLRRGGATDGLKLATADKVQLQGDWASDCYLRYNEVDESYRLELPTQLAQLAAATGTAE